jgi:hypothetical protein
MRKLIQIIAFIIELIYDKFKNKRKSIWDL